MDAELHCHVHTMHFVQDRHEILMPSAVRTCCRWPPLVYVSV